VDVSALALSSGHQNQFFFALQGRPVAPILAKFSMERSTPPCHILPKLVHRWEHKAPIKKTENFTKFYNINAPQGRFPCSISTKLSACTWSAFRHWCLKYGRIRSRGSEVIGV